jgi:hypothetical protein
MSKKFITKIVAFALSVTLIFAVYAVASASNGGYVFNFNNECCHTSLLSENTVHCCMFSEENLEYELFNEEEAKLMNFLYELYNDAREQMRQLDAVRTPAREVFEQHGRNYDSLVSVGFAARRCSETGLVNIVQKYVSANQYIPASFDLDFFAGVYTSFLSDLTVQPFGYCYPECTFPDVRWETWHIDTWFHFVPSLCVTYTLWQDLMCSHCGRYFWQSRALDIHSYHFWSGNSCTVCGMTRP